MIVVKKQVTKASKADDGTKTAVNFFHNSPKKYRLELKGIVLAVVNESNEIDGRVSKEAWMDAEAKIIIHNASPDAPPLAIESSSWQNGYKILNCRNEITKTYLKEVLPTLDIIEGARLKGVEISELVNYDCPMAKIWVPAPILPESVLIPHITKTNPFLNTDGWKVISRGEVKANGQIWRLRLNKQCVKQLERGKFQVDIGFTQLIVKPVSRWEMAATTDDKQEECNAGANSDQPSA